MSCFINMLIVHASHILLSIYFNRLMPTFKIQHKCSFCIGPLSDVLLHHTSTVSMHCWVQNLPIIFHILLTTCSKTSLLFFTFCFTCMWGACKGFSVCEKNITRFLLKMLLKHFKYYENISFGTGLPKIYLRSII